MRRVKPSANQYTSGGSTSSAATGQGTVRRDRATVEDVAWAFHPDREAWEFSGFTTWEETREWEATGLPPAVCHQWRTLGFSADDATAAKSAGMTPGLAVDARNAGIESVREAAAWRNAGFVFYQAGGLSAVVWRNAGFGPDEARRCRADGLTVPEAKRRRAVPVRPVTDPS